MNNLAIIAISAAITTIGMSPLVLASDRTAGETDFYAGIKTGHMYVALDDLDPKLPVGILLGVQKHGFGAEFEANYVEVESSVRDLDYETYALYGVFRTPGKYYAKIRAGYIHENLESSGSNSDWDDSGFSGGIVFGADLGQFSLEAGYTVIQADLKYFSLGANYHF